MDSRRDDTARYDGTAVVVGLGEVTSWLPKDLLSVTDGTQIVEDASGSWNCESGYTIPGKSPRAVQDLGWIRTELSSVLI